MQKVLLGLLGLLVLYFGTSNARLQGQVRHLEERLAAAEKKILRTAQHRAALPARGPVAAALEPTVASTTKSLGGPWSALSSTDPVTSAAAGVDPTGPPVPVRESTSLQLSGRSLSFTLKDDPATLVRAGTDEDLGLTDAQQKVLAELRKNSGAQTQAYTDMILQIEQQTEQSIRQLLSPEQVAKYDAQHPAVVATTTIDPVEEPRTASGLRQGYLGISGGNAEGGGARVTQVIPNTAAAALGLQKDDVILEFNGQTVPDLSALSGMIKESGEGFSTVLRIRRGSYDLFHDVQLGAMPR